MQDVNEQNFRNEIMESPLPVLVDLYADWCQPCKALEPILLELEKELSGKLKIVRINVDNSPVLAQGFGARSIPMMVLINEGKAVDQLMGLVDKATLKQFVKAVLPASSPEFEPKDLAALIQQNKVLAVDLRDANSFGRYRIPGAIHLPASEIENKLDELAPTDGKQRVLYGRGAEEGKEVAEKLQKHGVPVGFLAGGFLGWEAEGLDVEKGST